jgi:hypothetical protein
MSAASFFENQGAEAEDPEARAVIEDYLLDNDVPFTGEETFDELAALALKKVEDLKHPTES